MFKPTTAVWQPSASLLFKLSVITSAVAGIGLTTGCSSTPSSAKTQNSKQLGMLDANSLDSLEDLLSATDMRAVEGDRLLILKHGDVWKRMTVGFKMDETKWDPRIEAQRSWFITRQPYLDRLSARASRYLYHTVKEAERRGMPTELALLPVIESSYDPAATSTAAAAGMWQFIPSTGKIYGLRQTSLYDGRRDVVESTRAAYEFLGSLYNQFGSWELALAAYNAGPGRIQQAINRNKAAGLPTDYWSLKLPQETMNYVPRFLAVAQIIKSPQKYGVNLPPIANRPHFREISVPIGASLNQIASITGLSRAELYQLNPGHRGEVIDAQSPLRILIPADLNPNIDAKIKALKPSSGGYWAGGTTASGSSTNPSSPLKTTTTPSYTTPKVLSTTPPALNQSNNTTAKSSNNAALQAAVTQPNTSSTSRPTTTSATTAKGKTPVGSNALAAFASSATVPSAPRIPVAVTPAVNVKPVTTEPKLTEQERAQVLASLSPEETLAAQTLNNVAEPEATQAEKEEVVKEITALAPQGTEIVDPLDGKIKLTAIQTSQSVASQQGQEVKVGFAYPKSVADNTSASSDEAKLNQDKSFSKTESEVVVVPPKGKRSTYLVMPGDTLAVIAMKNGLNWRDIAKWNQVDPSSTLFVGTSLYLYDAKPVSDQKTEDKKTEDKQSELKQTTYVVKPNDSLSAVADQFNLSIQHLAEINHLSPNSNLYVGQKLALVETDAKKSEKKRDTKSSAKIKTKVYTVKRGEYLKQIADRYALSNQELASLTPELKSDSFLRVGQKINVPLEELNIQLEQPSQTTKTASNLSKVKRDIQTESYQVERGDTLYSIAMKSKMTLSELAELNRLSVDKGLMVGQRIQIPAGATLPSLYTVQSGDSLNAVAAKYNLSVSQIASLNGLSTSAGLIVGQKLKLSGEAELDTSSPSKSSKEGLKGSAKESVKSTAQDSNPASDIHVVASGETLASVARKYKLQLNYLAALNDLSRSAGLRVGQRLKIEGDLKTDTDKDTSSSTSSVKSVSVKNTEAYTVKAGESLNVIASRLGMSVKALADLNDLTPRSGLQRGQSIRVPKTVSEYRVKSGDSLIRLASRYGIDSNQLADMNDLKPNATLKIGDTIKVPNL